MKRIKLADRKMPVYSRGEEWMNMITHTVGGALGILCLIFCILKSDNTAKVVCSVVYGLSMILTYTVSAIYHGLTDGMAKRVMQVMDHCCIYALIAGTYTPIVVCAIAPTYPRIGWGLLALQWGLAALAVTLTAIDLNKYKVFSMICYIFLGWAVIFFIPETVAVLGSVGFGFLLAGGITYTVGAILFGLGNKIRWMHSVFHIFVVLGSLLQLVCILISVL